MERRRWLPLLALVLCGALLWPRRHALTAEAIAARSPEQTVLAAAFLLGLYVLKGLSMVLPLSVLEAAGGLLFPFPGALAVNLAGVALAQAVPYLLGRREQEGLTALTARYPRLAALAHPAVAGKPGRAVFLLRLGGASPGDLVSLYLGAAGVPWTAYFPAGLLGSLPRVAAATVLGAALWDIGGRRFWLSLAAGWGLSALSLLLWRVWRKRA